MFQRMTEMSGELVRNHFFREETESHVFYLFICLARVSSKAAVSSALQAGRDESSNVDEAQAVVDAKASVQLPF